MVQVQRVSLQHAGNSSDFGGVLYPDAGAVENRCVLLGYLRSESRSSVQSGGCHCLVGPMQQRQRYVLHTDSHYYSLDNRSLALFNLLQLAGVCRRTKAKREPDWWAEKRAQGIYPKLCFGMVCRRQLRQPKHLTSAVLMPGSRVAPSTSAASTLWRDALAHWIASAGERRA